MKNIKNYTKIFSGMALMLLTRLPATAATEDSTGNSAPTLPDQQNQGFDPIKHSF